MSLAILDALALPIGTDSEPPSEIHVFKWGENDTTKGKFIFDKESATQVLAAFADHGLPKLPMDYGHQTFHQEKNGRPDYAAAWLVPEVRDDGLWMKVDWTKRAAKKIRDRELLHYSQSFDFDDKRRVTRLLPFALLNWPATKKQLPLMAGAQAGTSAEEGAPMKSLLSALGLSDASAESEALKAVMPLVELRRDVMQLTGVESPAQAIGKLTAWKHDAQKLAEANDKLALLSAAVLEREAESLIADAKRAGKIDNGDTRTLEFVRDLAKRDSALLKSFLETLTPKTKAAQIEPELPRSQIAALSAEDIRMAQAMGNDPKKLQEMLLADRGVALVPDARKE